MPMYWVPMMHIVDISDNKMCYLAKNNKGWLRQFIPCPSGQQLAEFINGVESRLKTIKQPSDQQIEKARSATFMDMLGAVE